jgi:hypothetical protein
MGKAISKSMQTLSPTSNIGRQCPNREESSCDLILAVPNVSEHEWFCDRDWFLYPQSAARHIGRERWPGYIWDLVKVWASASDEIRRRVESDSLSQQTGRGCPLTALMFTAI